MTMMISYRSFRESRRETIIIFGWRSWSLPQDLRGSLWNQRSMIQKGEMMDRAILTNFQRRYHKWRWFDDFRIRSWRMFKGEWWV